MASDYESIRQANLGRYGTEVGNYGKFFQNQYSDPTHFIFELLQNAEDALDRRGSEWNGERYVTFDLTEDQLRFSHMGDPFTEEDVNNICQIGHSEKEEKLTAIGRFGIGFKSVYAITDQPRIHSGSENFRIKDYVMPQAAHSIARKPDETIFVLQFKSTQPSVLYQQIAEAFLKLELETLLFLRQIDKIYWSAEDGSSGSISKETIHEYSTSHFDVRRVSINSQSKDKHGRTDSRQKQWLVFSRPVFHKDQNVGSVEIAFEINKDDETIQPVPKPRLVVFFPTIIKTNLGFLIQGPYRTTPNREGIPSQDKWNRALIDETASLLRDSLFWLKEVDRLDTDVLECLPLEMGFDITNKLYKFVRNILFYKPLLPSFNEGEYITAKGAALGRGRAIRPLLSPDQLSELFNKQLTWLSHNITQNRTPRLRTYLMQELKVREIEPRDIISNLSREFLRKQSDGWVIKLYIFLNNQPILQRMIKIHNLPLIRLQDGSHVGANDPVFLPGNEPTNFPTVRTEICEDKEAYEFLCSLGLQEASIVDNVIQNILPKYGTNQLIEALDHVEYESDINSIVSAYLKDKGQRTKLINILSNTAFVLTVSAYNSYQSFSKPTEVYLTTERLEIILQGIKGVHFLDNSYAYLENQTLQEILIRAGANQSLRIINRDLSREERRKLRQNTDAPRTTDYNERYYNKVNNPTIDKLDKILLDLPNRSVDRARLTSRFLWEELIELRNLYGQDSLEGKYIWKYQVDYTAKFDASFIKLLNKRPWVWDGNEQLVTPAKVSFRELDWIEDPFLQSKINFKPAELEQLAQKAGVDVDLLDELKRRGITSVTEFNKSLGISDESDHPSQEDNIETQASSERQRPFGELIIGQQALGPSDSFFRPASIPEEGRRTRHSAVSDTERSAQSGREDRPVSKTTQQYELTDEAKEQKGTFRAMVKNDYQGRCQICGNFFRTRKGKRDQTFISHIVPPSKDFRTNHFGNMLGLCGWHYALMKHGDRDLLNPKTQEPVDTSENLEQVSYNLEKVIDEDGQSYRALPVRFYNVYPQWQEKAESIDEEIRLSGPHWRYLCELLKGPVGNDE